jgi:hypothetical protein
MPGLYHAWVYLQSGPLLGLTATLLAWQGASWLDQRARHAFWSNPIVSLRSPCWLSP